LKQTKQGQKALALAPQVQSNDNFDSSERSALTKSNKIFLEKDQTTFFHYEGPKEKKNDYVKHITDPSSLSRTNPLLAVTAAIIFFSNAGIPPLAGSYGKLNVFLAAVENSMYFLALAGILRSVMGAFHSIRLVKIIHYHSMSDRS
jgi:NADH:ubiquinone oxidoreductase subunit 2 (subunit N)